MATTTLVAAISILTAGHFSTSPRVWKEADALAAAGFDVEVFGVAHDPVQAESDDRMAAGRQWSFTPVLDLVRNASPWRRFRARLERRIAKTLVDFGGNTPAGLGFGVRELLDRARRRNADLTIVHLETPLWVGAKLSAAGKRIGVDIEDWHSQNAAAAGYSPSQVRMLEALERTVLRAAMHRTTTSEALARELSAAYDVAPPTVVHNGVAGGNEPGPAPTGPPRFVWFSQTVGPGRGLENVFAALSCIPEEWRLTLLGRCRPEVKTWALAQLPPVAHDRVTFVDYVPPDALHAEIAKHDVGLAPETDRCRNAFLTLSNKTLQYLQSGAFVVASATAGQTEALAELPDSGVLTPLHDVDVMALAFRRCSADLPAIRAARHLRARAADEKFAYERSAERLVASVRQALR